MQDQGFAFQSSQQNKAFSRLRASCAEKTVFFGHKTLIFGLAHQKGL
jgi:hypothetical protein